MVDDNIHRQFDTSGALHRDLLARWGIHIFMAFTQGFNSTILFSGRQYTRQQRDVYDKMCRLVDSETFMVPSSILILTVSTSLSDAHRNRIHACVHTRLLHVYARFFSIKNSTRLVLSTRIEVGSEIQPSSYSECGFQIWHAIAPRRSPCVTY